MVPATSRPLKMSNLFYFLTPLIAGTLRVLSINVMPPGVLCPCVSGGTVRACSLGEGNFLEDAQLHDVPSGPCGSPYCA